MVNNAEKKNRTKVEDLVKVQGTCVNYQLPTMGASGKYRPAKLTLQDGDKRHAVQDFALTTDDEFTFRIFPSPLEECKNKYFEFMVEPSINRTTGVQDTFESQYGTTHKWMAKNLINDPFEGVIEAAEQGADPKPVAKLTLDEIRSMQIAWNSAINNAVTTNPIKDWVVTEATEDQPRLFDVEHLEKWVQEIDLLASAIYPLIRRGAENPSEVEDDDVIETLSAEDK